MENCENFIAIEGKIFQHNYFVKFIVNYASHSCVADNDAQLT